MIDDYFKPGLIIERNDQTKDDSLGQSDSWSNPSGKDTSGLIRALSGREKSFGGAIMVESTHRMYAPAKTDITEHDRVTDQEGNVYDVLFVDKSAGSDNVVRHLQILLLLRK